MCSYIFIIMKNLIKKTFGFVKKYLTIIIILFIFLFLYICDNSSNKAGNVIISNLKSIATSFTPTTDLFDDGSEVSFVGYFFGMKANKQEEKTVFYLPVSIQNLSESSDYLSYNFEGAISSIANGEVISVGYSKDNLKYIEIQHSNGYVSLYVGLDNIGVSIGVRVNARNPIGLCSVKQNVKIYIYKNGNLIKPSEIEWKN